MGSMGYIDIYVIPGICMYIYMYIVVYIYIFIYNFIRISLRLKMSTILFISFSWN